MFPLDTKFLPTGKQNFMKTLLLIFSMSKSGYLFAEQIAIYFSSLKSCGKQNIISAAPHPPKDAHTLIFEARTLLMWLRVQTLKWEDCPGYSRGPNLIIWALETKDSFPAAIRGRCDYTKKGPKNATLLALKSEEGDHELSDVCRFQKLENTRKGILLWSLQKNV